MKATGKEWNEFYECTDPVWFPDDASFEGYNLSVNDEELDTDSDFIVPPDSIVRVSGGVILSNLPSWREPSVEGYFTRWLKARNIKTIIVEYQNANHDAVIAAIKLAGGRVV